MMPGAALPETLIGRVALRAPDGQPDGHGPDLAGILDRSDFAVPGLPASAILIVREFACSLPSGGRGRPPVLAHGLDLRERLADLARLAARPDLERVPQDAPAVLFANQGRLLATLADDLANGIAGRCWWWRLPLRRLAGGQSGPAAVGEVLAADPASVPAAVDHLARLGRLAPVFAALSPAQAERAGAAVAQAYGLAGEPARQWPVDERFGSGRRTAGGVAPEAPEDLAAPEVAPPEGLAAAIGRVAAEARLIEREAPARLAALALTLHRHPGLALEPGFAAAMAAWPPAQPMGRGSSTGDRPPRSGRPATPEADSGSDPIGNRAAPTARPSATRSSFADATEPMLPASDSHPAAEPSWMDRGESKPSAAPTRSADGAEAGPHAEAPPSRPKSAEPATADRSSSLREGPLREADLPEGGAAPGDSAMPPLPADADYPDPALEGIPTRLGGALFLVNVMSALDLPACFAPAWPLERAVGHWGVLRGLAGALAADLQEDVDSDPIWPALAALCPEPQPDQLNPGAPLAVPEAWRDWAPPEAEPPLPAPSLPAFDRWLAFVAPLLRRRIAMALGVEPADAGSCLLRRHGRLHVDGPHVELVMALDEAGPAVRAAGLDRDPGWHPGFGRVILFHYR